MRYLPLRDKRNILKKEILEIKDLDILMETLECIRQHFLVIIK